MMMTLLGAEPHVVERQVRETKGSHAKITYLKDLLKIHVKGVNDNTEEGDLVEANKFQDFDIRVYSVIGLLYSFV
jgi:hypothetical protein